MKYQHIALPRSSILLNYRHASFARMWIYTRRYVVSSSLRLLIVRFKYLQKLYYFLLVCAIRLFSHLIWIFKQEGKYNEWKYRKILKIILKSIGRLEINCFLTFEVSVKRKLIPLIQIQGNTFYILSYWITYNVDCSTAAAINRTLGTFMTDVQVVRIDRSSVKTSKRVKQRRQTSGFVFRVGSRLSPFTFVSWMIVSFIFSFNYKTWVIFIIAFLLLFSLLFWKSAIRDQKWYYGNLTNFLFAFKQSADWTRYSKWFAG